MVVKDAMLRAKEQCVQDELRLHIRNQQTLARAAPRNHSELEQFHDCTSRL